MISSPITDTNRSSRRISKKTISKVEWILILIMLLGYCAATLAQSGNTDEVFEVKSEFSVSVKNAVKFSEVPEIKDSVKRISNINYPITSKALFPKYEAEPIQPAKMQNEPLDKLYRSLLKLGYSPFYNMPYAEFWLSNRRSKENSYGIHVNHLSSSTHLNGVGYGGFSQTGASIFGKKFYKKHTLFGDFNYDRNAVHYYGYDTSINHVSNDFTKQRYQLFEPRLRLQSHYTDSNHINHDIRLSFYNLTNLYREAENNVKLDAQVQKYLGREVLNVGFLTDFYNHKQSNDTINDLIMTLAPSLEGGNDKLKFSITAAVTMDHFGAKNSFYFYPKVHAEYDIYEHLVIPYAGANGGLIKNSMRAFTTENPFVDTTIKYQNTNNAYNLYGGLKGKLSSKTGYDVNATFSQLNNLYYYVIDYSGPPKMYNQFKVVYDNTKLFKVTGELHHTLREKLNLIAKGNYYYYKPDTLLRPYHRPEFDLTFSGVYNLASKIFLKADVYIMGKQWSLTRVDDGANYVMTPRLISGWADVNLEGEYRYSKMLSLFVRFNNIASQRYYRWERYPSQRFSMMIGLSYIPF